MSWRSLLPNDAGVAMQFQCASTTTATMTLNSSGDRAAAIIPITRTGNIRKVRFRTATVTTGDTVRVSLQDLDASGDPDGTPDQSATQVIADANDNTYFQVTLDADRAVTAGDLVAVVIDFSSYVAGNLQISVGAINGEAVTGNLAATYIDFYDGASWAKTAGRAPQIILEYDDGTVAYQPACLPAPINSALTYNSSSTPDENGNIIKFDETTRVVGAEFFADTDGAVSVVLYDTDGTTALATAVVNIVARVTNQQNKTAVFFSSGVACVGGSQYRLVLKPTTTTNFSTLQSANDAAAAGDLNVMIGGADWHKTSRTDAGAWTENTLRRVAIWPIIDAIDIRDAHIASRQATLLRQ